jgi:hypothetical protein
VTVFRNLNERLSLVTLTLTRTAQSKTVACTVTPAAPLIVICGPSHRYDDHYLFVIPRTVQCLCLQGHRYHCGRNVEEKVAHGCNRLKGSFSSWSLSS